jgi:hypothetical protein
LSCLGGFLCCRGLGHYILRFDRAKKYSGDGADGKDDAK